MRAWLILFWLVAFSCLYGCSDQIDPTPAATPPPQSTSTAVPPASVTARPATATPTAPATSEATPAPARPTEAPEAAVGRELFRTLPCSACHGSEAEGAFGPRLAGTSLTFEQVRTQVREPRNQMPPFDEEVVSDDELRQIYAWLTEERTGEGVAATPPAEAPASPTRLPPAEATRQALDERYRPMDGAALREFMDQLDEVTIRFAGELLSLEEQGRYTTARVRVGEGDAAVEAIVLYDSAVLGGAFPLSVGERATFYGVGAEPIQQGDERLPHMQVLHIVP